MTVSIIHTILGWVLGVFAPGSGRRRADSRAAAPAPEQRPVEPRTAVPWPPALRSPYGLAEPLDGHAAALVRPYVLEAERARGGERARQYRRRVALVIAADFGIDLDRHVIGAEGLAR